ncbi:putative adventurous gliding motility protein [Corallococcus coralloides]|uniref:Putative adventurous gliding motility protein n=1 Tax=Corallococcus coralloides TaxID=184914 RepID=A0A410RWX8_CORCK|nr:zinc-ribbon domain-containing protein [Corallococcus coralloides]QAT86454.1 putative adventurous gliding motility protein [Corallococcus coralloides]
MRIVCQKCAAAYAIDDRLITTKGVRAQCPRCRHLQLVKREASAASVTAPAEGAVPPAAAEPKPPAAAPAPLVAREPRSHPAAAPVAAKPPEPLAAPKSDLFGDFGELPELGPPGSVDPFADLGPPASQVTGGLPPDPFANLGPSVPAPAAKAAPAAKPGPPVPAAPGVAAQAKPAAPAVPEDPLLDFLGPAPGGLEPDGAPTPGRASSPPAGAVSLGRMSARAPAPVLPKPETHTNCRSCGKDLADPFDQALGICEACKQRESAFPREPTVLVAPEVAPPPSDGGALVELPVMSGLDGAGAGDEPRSEGATALAPDSRVSSVKPARTSHLTAAPVRSAQRGGSGGSRAGVFSLLALAVLGAGGAGYYFLVHKPQQEQRVRDAQPAAPAAVPAEVLATVGRWKLQFLELEGTREQHLAAGQKQLALDQRIAYAEAEESFQQALLLDPHSTDAIAGYVQALALGRGPGMDDNSFQEARELIQAATRMAGETPALLVAHANLLLARSRQAGNLEEAARLATEVLSQSNAADAYKAEAHLVLGRSQVATSRALANQEFEAARKLAPNLQRVDFYSALAHEQAGQYGLALKQLRQRMELDPQDWNSAEAAARIYVEVGETARARKLYEDRLKAKAGDVRASLALAVLRYQAEGNAREAVRVLKELTKNASRYGPRDASEIFSHLAAAERTAGNDAAAATAAAAALKAVPAMPEAHLQWFLVALAQKDAALAREHLKGFQGRLEDAALEKVLEGRVHLLEGDVAKAQERFQQAVRLDDRRMDAKLLEGVAAASAKKRDEAFRLFYPVLEARVWDPLRLAPRPALSRFWLRPGDTLVGVENVVKSLGDRPEDVQPLLYEALVRFHQGDRQTAERLLSSVVEVNANSGGAQAYRALIALDTKGPQARNLAVRAVGVERGLPVARLSLGLALAAAGDVAGAMRALQSALDVAPKMLSAQTKLAELLVTSKPQEARAVLEKVVGLDPSYFPAKKLLFKLDERG